MNSTVSIGLVFFSLFICLVLSVLFAVWVTRWVYDKPKQPDSYGKEVEECETPGACPDKLEPRRNGAPESPRQFRDRWGLGDN